MTTLSATDLALHELIATMATPVEAAVVERAVKVVQRLRVPSDEFQHALADVINVLLTIINRLAAKLAAAQVDLRQAREERDAHPQNAATINEAGGVEASTQAEPGKLNRLGSGDEPTASSVSPHVGVAPGPASPQDDALIYELRSLASAAGTRSGVLNWGLAGLADCAKLIGALENAAARLRELSDELAAAYKRIDDICADAAAELREEHAKTAAATSRTKALHAALRKRIWQQSTYPYKLTCDVCTQTWEVDDKECHAVDCLAAPE